jgi:phospholipid transport system substrate-binding protein
MRTFGLLLLGTALLQAGPSLAASSQSLQLPQRSDILVMADAKMEAGAKAFVQSMADRAIGFLGDSALSHDQRKQEFKKLLRSSFDMSTIGRFAMGRYWREATPAQQKEYQSLFETMVINVYAARFNEYNGQKLEVGAVRPEGKADALVTSYIIPKTGEKIQVDWRVRTKGGGYKIVDVVVEGVSMALTQRSDFAAVIQRGGGDINVLIEHLRAR